MNLIPAANVYPAESQDLACYGADAMACADCYRLYASNDLPGADETCICAEETEDD